MGFVNWGSFIIQLINIAVIIYVMNRFLFKPYLAYLDAETKRREEMEAHMANVKDIEVRAKAEAETLVKSAKAEAKDMLTQAEAMAKKERALILSDAKQEAESIKKKAEGDIANERLALENELKDKVLGIALSINEKLFGKNEANIEFIKKAANEAK